MKSKSTFATLIVFVLFLHFNCVAPKIEGGPVKNIVETDILSNVDGPYIYSNNDSVTVITVDESKGKNRKKSSYVIADWTAKKSDGLRFRSTVDNIEKDEFEFPLSSEYTIPPTTYDQQKKIFVTSDIEGNFNTMYSLLIGNRVMDKDYNWIFGDGHVVICGDMMDRGTDVLPCLWLLYLLEQNARKGGGQVHFILGNHDVMNLQLDIRYVADKYLELAKIVSGISDDDQAAYLFLMSDRNELVKWIKSKNAVEKIGNCLFLHAGISDEVVDSGLSLEEINDIVRQHIRQNLHKYPSQDEHANLMLGPNGPLWYRGLVRDYKDYYKKSSEAGVDRILQFYGVEHIIIGHTIVDDQVTTDFNGKVIRVDIKHPREKFSGKSSALLIDNNNYYKINDTGEKIKLDFDE